MTPLAGFGREPAYRTRGPAGGLGVRMTPLAALLAGAVGGALHVVSGPDHLAAVMPLSAGSRWRRAAAVGLAWGVGHGLGVVVLVTLGQIARGWVAVDRIGGGAEVAVGLLLVGLGAMTLQRARRLEVVVHAHPHRFVQPHAHPHVHQHAGDDPHAHVHIADPTVGTIAHAASPQHDTRHHVALAFGVLHGLGGASHLVGLLPSLAFGPAAAALYGVGYLGSAIAMMAGVAAIASVGLGAPGRLRWALFGTGTLAVLVGVFWVGAALRG